MIRDDVSIDTIAKGDGSRLVEPRRFVVRDPQSFAAVWAAHAGPETPVPQIDFSTRMVAAVFAGERPTPGFEVDITGTRREADALVVIVDETIPDPSRAAAQVIVSPYHVVSLPRDDGKVRFNTADPTGQETIIFKPPKPRTTRAPQTTRTAETVGPETTRTARTGEPETTRMTRIAPVKGSLADGLSSKSSTSSTGLTPQIAAAMAYLAGPFSGALILATEQRSEFVRFHAWQAVVALGVLGSAAVLFLFFAFALLIVSPTAFWAMLWLAAATGGAWVVLWGMCLVHAYKGRLWKLPFAGEYAERKTTTLRASEAP